MTVVYFLAFLYIIPSYFLGEYVPLSLLVYDDIISGCIRL